jgi:Zn-dependent peptidase ImmA (M78 family)
MKSARPASEFREQANRILKHHRVTEPPVPVEKIAQALGISVRYSPFEGELAGMLVRAEEGRTIIGVNSMHHINRQRFTIAHECGHFLLHEGEVHIDRTFRVNRRDTTSSMATDPEEIEANRFAAELLMPYAMLVKDLKNRYIDMEHEETLQELAERYKVSVQAMTHRITNILDEPI